MKKLMFKKLKLKVVSLVFGGILAANFMGTEAKAQPVEILNAEQVAQQLRLPVSWGVPLSPGLAVRSVNRADCIAEKNRLEHILLTRFAESADLTRNLRQLESFVQSGVSTIIPILERAYATDPELLRLIREFRALVPTNPRIAREWAQILDGGISRILLQNQAINRILVTQQRLLNTTYPSASFSELRLAHSNPQEILSNNIWEVATVAMRVPVGEQHYEMKFRCTAESMLYAPARQRSVCEVLEINGLGVTQIAWEQVYGQAPQCRSFFNTNDHSDGGGSGGGGSGVVAFTPVPPLPARGAN